MRRWRRFLALEAAQRGVFLWSLAVLPLAAAMLRWRGFAAAREFVGRVPALAVRAMAPESAARMVDAAAVLTGASCVPRSLVLWRLTRARGALIRIGVARDAPRGFAPHGIAAHAWVEIEGRALNDTDLAIALYSVFPPHPRISGAPTSGR